METLITIILGIISGVSMLFYLLQKEKKAANNQGYQEAVQEATQAAEQKKEQARIRQKKLIEEEKKRQQEADRKLAVVEKHLAEIDDEKLDKYLEELFHEVGVERKKLK